MSTFKQRRCSHCKIRYDYQVSGYGGLQEYNSETYCQDCYKVVLDALKAVPVKRKPDWVGTSDVSAKTLVDLEQKQYEAADAKGGLFPPFRRVLPGLYDLERPDNHHKQGILRHEGHTCKYEYWTQQGGIDAGQANVQVERDVLTGDILGPWDFSDRWTKPPTFIEHPPWPSPPPATHKFRLEPIPSGRISPFELLERDPQVPLRESQEYVPGGPRSFVNETLPDESLPILDEDPEE